MAKSDFSQMKQFTEQLEKLASGEEIELLCRSCAKELAARFLTKVIKRTPVGKGTFEAVIDDDGKRVKHKRGKNKGQTKLRKVSNGGTLRRGWTAATEAEARNGSGKDPVAYVNSMLVERIGKKYRIIIINPVSYASYVEYGHRQKAGRYIPAIGKKLKKGWSKGHFMMTISANEIRKEAPGILEKRFEAFLKEVLRK
ncbi:hypothetical protein P22_1967 [Propionispora sp. 2/2-37]|uniref:HK97 gp10 family phage protein n=1 Tax=Propionispora sp. 2/2-37 TaxID=1677858 RepID=UPI0006BB8EC0|nr:HK97 gp10 family phage protein [Propionispora sp. 2/2-37]CUH95881.1 hypothetical protein P22_1967 [Propionispora sp. 2/2-37]